MAVTAPPVQSPAPMVGLGRGLAALLMLLTIFGPISMDVYLPVLPALTVELGAGTSTAQLTLTACLVGLAVGQLVAGPLSDRFGRRCPLLIGIGAYLVASVLCAVSPSIEALVAARLVQGLAGAVGIVIAQASGRDVYSGGALIRFYGRLTVLGGLAAIVGPVIGGQLARLVDWRGIFGFLAVVGALLLLAVALVFDETLPPQRRTSGGLSERMADLRSLFADRGFVAAVLIGGLSYAAIFAYLSGSTYILQETYGLSPQQYSLAFGANSLGFVIFGHLGGRLAERWSTRGALLVGIAVAGLGAAGILATGLLGLSLIAILLSLFIMASGVALSSPANTTMALADHPELAGTASSIFGCARYGLGGIAAPLVGLGGGHAATPLGVVTTGSMVLVVVVWLFGLRTRSTAAG